MGEWANVWECAMKITFARDYRNSDNNNNKNQTWKREIMSMRTLQIAEATDGPRLLLSLSLHFTIVSNKQLRSFQPLSLSFTLRFILGFSLTRCRLCVYLLKPRKLESMHVVKCKCVDQAVAAREKEKWFSNLSLHQAKTYSHTHKYQNTHQKFQSQNGWWKKFIST